MTKTWNFSAEESALVKAKENALKKLSLAKIEGRCLVKYQAEVETSRAALLSYRQQHGLLSSTGARIPTGKSAFEASIQPRLEKAIALADSGQLAKGLAIVRTLVDVARDTLHEASKRAGKDLAPYKARRDEAVRALDEFRVRFGLKKQEPKPPRRDGAKDVKIVPIDLTKYADPEQAARRCAAVRLAWEKKQAADAVKARREANKMRIAAITAAAPQKPLYLNWD